MPSRFEEIMHPIIVGILSYAARKYDAILQLDTHDWFILVLSLHAVQDSRWGVKKISNFLFDMFYYFIWNKIWLKKFPYSYY